MALLNRASCSIYNSLSSIELIDTFFRELSSLFLFISLKICSGLFEIGNLELLSTLILVPLLTDVKRTFGDILDLFVAFILKYLSESSKYNRISSTGSVKKFGSPSVQDVEALCLLFLSIAIKVIF